MADTKYKWKPKARCGRANRTSIHHVIPQSRFPKGADVDTDNTVELDDRYHNTYHQLFANLTVEEIHVLIDLINQPNTRWNWPRIKQLRRDLRDHPIEMVRQKYEVS